MGQIIQAGGEKFQSVGYGWDFRLRAGGLAGNALVADDHVIHAAAFKVEAPEAQPVAEPYQYARRTTPA